jgi:hypothetical protein
LLDAHRDDGKRFVVHADEKLTAFLELERVARESLRRYATGKPTTPRRNNFNVFAAKPARGLSLSR